MAGGKRIYIVSVLSMRSKQTSLCAQSSAWEYTQNVSFVAFVRSRSQSFSPAHPSIRPKFKLAACRQWDQQIATQQQTMSCKLAKHTACGQLQTALSQACMYVCVVCVASRIVILKTLLVFFFLILFGCLRGCLYAMLDCVVHPPFCLAVRPTQQSCSSAGNAVCGSHFS